MSKFSPRDVGPFLQLIRDFLLGRKHTLAVRFQPWLATRSPPPPNLPEGSAAKLSSNYYVSRDARREVSPPIILTAKTALPSGDTTTQSMKIRIPTPGKVYKWD